VQKLFWSSKNCYHSNKVRLIFNAVLEIRPFYEKPYRIETEARTFNHGENMNRISKEIVEKTWQEAAEMSEKEGIKSIEKFAREQPAILAYLMGAGGDMVIEEDRELMLYLGMVVWKIMSRGDRPLKEITMEELEAEEEVNFKVLEDLTTASAEDMLAFTAKMLSDFNQIEILKYVVETIMEDEDFDEEAPDFGDDDMEYEEDDEFDFDEDDLDIEDEAQGLMLIYLKTVINCFDKE